MPEHYETPAGGTGHFNPRLTPDESDGSTSKDVAKQQAAEVGQKASDAGQHVAGVAKEQGSQVVGEAGRQAKDLLDQASGQLSEQAGVQQQKLAVGLRSLSSELSSMAHGNESPGVATDLAHQAAERSGALAGWLDGHDPSDVLSEIGSFARRRPGAFLAIAAGVGFAAGRLTRGLTADGTDDAPEPSVQQSAGVATRMPASPMDLKRDPGARELEPVFAPGEPQNARVAGSQS